MLACATYSATVGDGGGGPSNTPLITWTTTGVAYGADYLDTDKQYLESLPSGSITLVRYAITSQGALGTSGPPYVQIQLDAGSPLAFAVTPVQEYGAYSVNMGIGPTVEIDFETDFSEVAVTAAGSILLDSDNLPGATPLPYYWEANVNGMGTSPVVGLLLMSWAKP